MTEHCTCWRTCYYGHCQKQRNGQLNTGGYRCDYATIEDKPRTVRQGKKIEQGKVVDGKCGFYITKREKPTQKRREREFEARERAVRNIVNLAELKELHKQGLCIDQIAEQMGCNKEQVKYGLKLLGLKANKKRSKRHFQMLRLYQSGLIDREIAAEVGVRANAVRLWRQREGLPSNYRRGSKQE